MGCEYCEGKSFHGVGLLGARIETKGFYFIRDGIFFAYSSDDKTIDRLKFSFCPGCGERLSKTKIEKG